MNIANTNADFIIATPTQIDQLIPGESGVYHIGFLARDRDKNKDLDALANYAARQYCAGHVLLSHKRLTKPNPNNPNSCGSHAYIVTKRRTRGPKSPWGLVEGSDREKRWIN